LGARLSPSIPVSVNVRSVVDRILEVVAEEFENVEAYLEEKKAETVEL